MASCATAPSDPDMLGGREVYATCSACHGADGAGGVGPALTEVRTTFGDCADHIRWIQLGSERWKNEVGPTYGSQNTVIDKVMPSFDSLDDQALRRVAMYERVRFGGGDPESERAACGLG
jgi:mono/diheme cytochrome c family protein